MCKRTCVSSTCSSDDTAACSHAVKHSSIKDPMVRPAATAAETQPTSRDKPSPFATEMGQAVLDCLLEDPIMTATRAAASAATTAAALAAGTGSKIPTLPRSKAIKAAISMPPMLAEPAHSTQQQEAVLQPDQLQMRKLASVPASNARLLPRTKTTTKQGMAGLQQQPEPVPHHVVTTVGPVIQGWSSLPSAGLRTCSSLKQLNLKLSGAPPSPADLMDLSKLMHLTHLSFKQVWRALAVAGGGGCQHRVGGRVCWPASSGDDHCCIALTAAILWTARVVQSSNYPVMLHECLCLLASVLHV